MSSYFSTTENEVLDATNITAALLSFFGTSLLLISYFCFEHIRTFPLKLITTLFFFDFMYSISNLLSPFDDNPIICTFEGFLRSLSFVGFAFWIGRIQIFTYYQITNYNVRKERDYKRWLIISILVALIPTAGVIISAIFDLGVSFGQGLGFCYVQPDNAALLLCELPIWINLSFAIVFSYLTYKQMQNFDERIEIKAYRNIWIYPVVGVACCLPELVDRILLTFRTEPVFIILLLHYFFLRIEGFVNVLVYGWKSLSNLCRRCLKPKQTLDDSYLSLERSTSGDRILIQVGAI